MTNLKDHAEAGGGPEIYLVSDLPQRPAMTIASADLLDSDDLTDEGQFPEHGSFLEVVSDDGELEYWECPGSLAQVIMAEVDEQAEAEAVEGARLSIEHVAKTPSGEWRFSAAVDVD